MDQTSKNVNWLDGLLIEEKERKRKGIFVDSKQNTGRRQTNLQPKDFLNQYITLSEDGIGLRILCKICNKIFYYFEFSDHFQQYHNKEQENKDQKMSETIQKRKQERINEEIEESMDERKEGRGEQEAIEKQIQPDKGRVQIDWQNNQINIEGNPRTIEIERQQKTKKKEIDFNASFVELQQFQEKKKKISRIFSKNQEYQKKPHSKQEFTEVPCPFCAKILPLSELNHIDKCDQAVQCKFCHDKYPLPLYEFHLMECKQNPSKTGKFMTDRMIDQYLNGKKQEKKQEGLKKQLKSKNDNVNIHQYSDRAIKKEEISRQPKPFRRELPEAIDVRAMEEQSRIRHQNLTGLPSRELKKLNSEIYMPQQVEKEDCAICSFDFQLGDSVKRLPCEHLFHSDCLLPWLKERSTCPTCKAPIKK